MALNVPPVASVVLESDLDSLAQPREALKTEMNLGLVLSSFMAITVSREKVESETTSGS